MLPPDAVRVAILDASVEFALVLTEYVTADAPDLHVVLFAKTWPELITSHDFPTRVVFLDADAGESVSLRARIRACRAAGAVVVVTTAVELACPDGHELLAHVDTAGAAGLISKCATFSGLLELVRGPVSTVAPPLVREDWRPPPAPLRRLDSGSAAGPPPKLSRGEAEALALYASGKTVAEVASAMNVQYETAKTFLRRVREKYAQQGRSGTKRAELTRYATEDGFLT